jgi:hypothetical protein
MQSAHIASRLAGSGMRIATNELAPPCCLNPFVYTLRRTIATS